MKETLVKSLMTRTVTCLKPDTPLRDGIKQMVENRFSCIVIEQDGMPFGIVTERDLVGLLNCGLKEFDLSDPVSEIMNSPVLVLHQDESLFDALVVIRAEPLRHLPVVDDAGKMVGLVTQSDLANAHFEVNERQSELMEHAIAKEIDVLQKVNDALQALSMEDHLLKIGNRRAMEVDLGHIHANAVRYKDVYSILLVDVDMFKRYNDHYGHQLGDDALVRIADILKSNIRKADRLYRYGGEELLVVLPHVGSEQLAVPAAKLITAIAAEQIPHKKSPFGIVTVSIGAACAINGDSVGNQWEQVVQLADKCLYEAKEKGRNQSIVAKP